MTESPVQRERADVVKRRLGGFQEASVCACTACQAANVTDPPVWVPDGAEQDADGRWMRMARPLHGLALAQHQRMVRGFAERLREAVKGSTMRGARSRQPHYGKESGT